MKKFLYCNSAYIKLRTPDLKMRIVQKIIKETAANMHGNRAVFEDEVIVPNVFVIYLGKEDHAAIQSLLKKLREQITKRLDKELAKGKKNNKKLLQRILASLINFIGGDAVTDNKEISTLGNWDLSFVPTTGDFLIGDNVIKLKPGEICIVSSYSDNEPKPNNLISQLKTNITFFNSGIKQTIAATVAAADSLPNDSPPTRNPYETRLDTKPVGTADLTKFAVLTIQYHGDSAPETFDMIKDEITVGRDTKSDLVLLKASERISRKHLEIQLKDGKFYLKSFGVYGTLLQGKPVPIAEKVVDNTTVELNKSVEIPAKARISLAGGEVLIDFVRTL